MQTLILLPGLLNDAALWQNQIKGLQGKADCMVPDLTGHNSIAALADSVLAAAPERFALAGFSMGGYVAFAMLRKAPQRITRLCLLDTAAAADNEEQAARRRGLIELAQKGVFKGITPRLVPSLLAKKNADNVGIAEAIMAMAARIGREGFIQQQTAIVERPDSTDLLAKIAVPTAIINGAEDNLWPVETARAMHAAIKGATLDVYENAGHITPLEAADKVTERLREWLTR